tara:strand:+ start:15097 stop:16254 length:1158 start_codon:yes stop_codon:yes gene_type:complete
VDFSLNPEQALIQQTAQQFAQQQLAPVAAAIDQHRQHDSFLANLKQLAELGFMGLSVNSDYGGSEAGTIAFSLAITELAKACAATATTTSVTNLVAEVIQAIGSEAQKQRYLPKICSGEYAAASFCLTEAQAGSDPAAMQTKAVKLGNDWLLNGSKLYITSALYAGVFVVWAVTDPAAAKGKGISCFLVEAGSPGLEIDPPENKMGQHGSYTSVVSFSDCRISHSALLGRENIGYRIAVAELAGGRIGIGSLALGLGLAAMDYAKQFVGEREQFGQKLGHFQGLQWMIADCYTELEAARLLLMQAATLKQQGQPFATQAAMAKLYASEKANHACYTALQLLGGAGYLQDHPLERMSRDVRLTTIYEGTSEIQRLIIARDLLKDIL